LSTLSPWSYNSATAIGVSTIAWISFMQLASSGVGGYLAGRLRVKWTAVHTDEVFFRDTAHGLLSWAVASLFTVGLLSGTVQGILGGAVQAGAAAVPAAAGAVTAAATRGGAADNTGDMNAANGPVDYFSDLLLRTDQPPVDANPAAVRGEVTKILLTALHNGSLPAEDRDYLARVMARRTGVSEADAQQRVDAIYARVVAARDQAQAVAKGAADKARKAAAYSALWMFVALLLGAFVASLAATFGGRLRDRVEMVS
jgi:hypothetical protein